MFVSNSYAFFRPASVILQGKPISQFVYENANIHSADIISVPASLYDSDLNQLREYLLAEGFENDGNNLGLVELEDADEVYIKQFNYFVGFAFGPCSHELIVIKKDKSALAKSREVSCW